MIILDLTKGIVETEQYKAWKFPGGEIHFKSKVIFDEDVKIHARINNSDEFLFFCIVAETIKKEYKRSEIDCKISAYIPYMLYQQADRDFGVGECFSLETITTILKTLPVSKYTIFDPHSDQSCALLKAFPIDNSEYIKWVLEQLPSKGTYSNGFNVTLLSPDAGAYKKIGKLADKLQFKGEVAAANKYRSISTGNIESLELSKQDFEGKDVLIVDDICVGGRTFVELAKKLKEKNVGKLYLAVSHGIFSNGFAELSNHFERVFTTNSRTDEYALGIKYDAEFRPVYIDNNFLGVYKII